MKTERIVVNNQEYILKIYFQNRCNSRVSIGTKGINVRIPLEMSREEQFREIIKMKQWIIKKITESPDKFKKQELKEYKQGDVLKVGSDDFTLNIIYSNKRSSSARIINNNLFLNISSELSDELKNKHISTLLSGLVSRRRLPMLQEKIKKLNDLHFKMSLRKIFFKHNKSNWGSCSDVGNINISTRLLFAPDDVLEYVCIHELAHLIEHNHSDNFWKLVEKAMPDYKEKEQWLKENGGKCNF